MDCITNLTIPKSNEHRIVLRPISKTFINGTASCYEIIYDLRLKSHISQKEFNMEMDRLMDMLYMSWPCGLCFCFGYICCLCTLGLSFLFPGLKVRKAKQNLIEEIAKINKTKFTSRGLVLSYKSNCLSSWLEIELKSQNFELNEMTSKDRIKRSENQI